MKNRSVIFLRYLLRMMPHYPYFPLLLIEFVACFGCDRSVIVGICFTAYYCYCRKHPFQKLQSSCLLRVEQFKGQKKSQNWE